MAKRLDAASVISDPTFIEGPHNSYDGGHPSRGAYRMDDIASEESSSGDDSSSSSSEDSSSSSDGDYHHRERYEYKNHHHHGGGSRNRENRRRYNTKSRNHPDEGLRSHRDRGNGNGRSSDRRRREHHRQRNDTRQQQQQPSSSSMPSQPYYDNTYDSRGHQPQQKHNMSYPGAGGGGGGERKYSPPRGGATAAVPIIDPIMYASNTNDIPNKKARGGFREDPITNKRSSNNNNNNNKNSHEKQGVAEAYEKKQNQERYYDSREETESAKRRRTKMILIPSVVILIIGVVVAIAMVMGKGSGDDNVDNFQDENDNISAFQPIPFPTTSPTYFGLYQCPIGKSGPTVTKGCLGFIQCSVQGTAMGPIQYCSSGTLYDVTKGVCDFAENVSCSTNLPTQEEFAAGNTSPTATAVAGNTPPTVITPTTSSGGGVSVVSPPPTAVQQQQQKPPSITVGPITTSDHKLLFEGVINPGQLDNSAMNRIAKNLESYLNIFYSARVINAYNDGDYVLESIGNVTIGVVASKFEFVKNSNRRRNLLRRDLQTAANGFAMIYQQTTKYDTIDSAITVEAILRRPYQERYQDRIVSYLKASDPGIFSSLTRATFDEGDVGGQPAPQEQPVPVPSLLSPTRKPTIAPTSKVVSPPVPETNPPTKVPTTPPPVAATVPDSSGSYTIQGFMFFDENQNGIFEYDSERIFPGVWANLRLCTPKEDGNDWVKTGASEAQGLYQFDDVKENEYFVEFFRPPPGDDYNFTIPQVSGDDDSVFDSDVVGFTKNGGKTDCFTVGPGFDSNKFINAGFKLKPTPPPSPSPSKSPSQSPIDVSFYCADVTTTSTGEQNLNFFGCNIRCGNGFDECPGSLLCERADECIEPV